MTKEAGNDAASVSSKSSLSAAQQQAAIASFVEFLQFETVSSLARNSGAYTACSNWLVQFCRQQEIFDSVFLLDEAPDDAPVVVAMLQGKHPELPILLLNSHYDVVPADPDDWHLEAPPFSGARMKKKQSLNSTGESVGENVIYGRGTQDMKSVCVQYVLALKQIMINAQRQEREGHDDDSERPWKPERDIYLTFVPDEEVGGGGMAAFLASKLYKSFSTRRQRESSSQDNSTSTDDCASGIALALDEGLASTDPRTFAVFFGERLPWWVDVTATGPTGHGSRFIEHTAVEQLVALSRRALEFRQGQRQLLFGGEGGKHANCAHAVAAKTTAKAATTSNSNNNNTTLGDVTTLNITTMQAGVRVGDTFAYNCVPPVAKCSLDIRISPHTAPSAIKTMLDKWCQECSSSNTSNGNSDSNDNTNSNNATSTSVSASSLNWKFVNDANGAMEHAVTSTDPAQNPWYNVFANALHSQGHDIEPQVFPAATDSRFLRALGIRALGFSPMKGTEIMLHENNEYIPETVFIEGIDVYVGLLKALGEYREEAEH